MAGNWSPKALESLHHSLCIPWFGSDQDVEVARRSRNAMNGKGMSANDQKTNAGFLQRKNEILEIFVKNRFPQSAPLERMTLPGVSQRS